FEKRASLRMQVADDQSLATTRRLKIMTTGYPGPAASRPRPGRSDPGSPTRAADTSCLRARGDADVCGAGAARRQLAELARAGQQRRRANYRPADHLQRVEEHR